MLGGKYDGWMAAGAVLVLGLFCFSGCESGGPPADIALRVQQGAVASVSGTEIWREGAGKLVVEGGHDQAARAFGFLCSCAPFLFFFALEAWTELESRVWQVFWAILFLVFGAVAITAHGRTELDAHSKQMTDEMFVFGLRVSTTAYAFSQFDRIGYEGETDSDGDFSGYALKIYFSAQQKPFKLLRGVKTEREMPPLVGLISEITEVRIANPDAPLENH